MTKASVGRQPHDSSHARQSLLTSGQQAHACRSPVLRLRCAIRIVNHSVPITELRDSAEARRFLLQGLWLSRLVPPSVESLGTALHLAAELLSVGDPLPPLGLVSDVGHLVLDATRHSDHGHSINTDVGLSPETIQRYEDYVLGKLYADGGFERGATAICRYAEKDRLRGTAWLIGRFADRAGWGGVHLSPGVVRGLQNSPREEILAEGAASLRTEGLMPLLQDAYRQIIERVRHLGDVLGVEDVFELEHGTVLVEFGQRLALRQMLQMAAQLESAAPLKPPHLVSRHRSVPTHLLDEDTYPVGGFSSISNTGTIESLLHSQLAYMEPATGERPDLFDIKFLRGELLYYARDENEFLRRRRSVLLLLSPDLVETRLKDVNLPCQRIILVLASMLTIVRRLQVWLSGEALQIEILVPTTDQQVLDDERELLTMALQDQVNNGTVCVGVIAPTDLHTHIEATVRRSLTSVVDFAVRNTASNQASFSHIAFRTEGPQPVLRVGGDTVALDEDGLCGWKSAVSRLMIALLHET
jgi:hypothetical protein